MSRRRKALLATGTLALALGTLAHWNDALASRFEEIAETVVFGPGPRVVEELDLSGLDGEPETAAAPGPLPETLDRPAGPDAPARVAALEPGAAPRAGALAEIDCDTSLSAEAQPNALVALTLTSPCRPGTTVTVHHRGLVFSLRTDEAGDARALVPALSDEAVFIAALDVGDGAVATLSVPDAGTYERAVLQWQGETGLSLHARAPGAGYDEEGHVHRAAAGRPSSGSGFLLTLGDPALPDGFRAEIYSAPARAEPGASVTLGAEAAITAATCGKEITARAMQVGPGRDMQTRDLALTLPDCDGEEGYLVLKNLFRDLKIDAK